MHYKAAAAPGLHLSCLSCIYRYKVSFKKDFLQIIIQTEAQGTDLGGVEIHVCVGKQIAREIENTLEKVVSETEHSIEMKKKDFLLEAIPGM